MDDRRYFQRSDGDTEYDSNLRIKWSSDQGDKGFLWKKETFIFVRLDILRDIFTGDTISYENRVLGDNEYVWSDELIYYVEKYNAKLPNEFVNHILKSY